MQIFNDRKKRIGTLSGFKDRAITTTLDSGDKEMTFAYPASGALVGLLQEEYYIRTKTDEFVIKAVEKGEQFNKYTAVLNVEELEGTAFPYGFESDEQTIRACLEFAFEGTGWHVGTCTVTKKRTIDEQENITAWDVLQKCLSTYRCECIIDSINKTVNIYERIGSDKGCYFIEGINLRKISLKSDTYDFYTRKTRQKGNRDTRIEQSDITEKEDITAEEQEMLNEQMRNQMMLLYEMEKDEIEVQEEQNRIIERMEESE